MTAAQPSLDLLRVDDIRPDPNQPRHLFPTALTEGFVAGERPAQVLTTLRSESEKETWLQAILSELGHLADSVAKDGLMEPIRVVPHGEGYLIEEGERRWWAHVILLHERHLAIF